MNIRSVHASFYKFEHFLHRLPVQFDIIVLIETWLKKAELFYKCLSDFITLSLPIKQTKTAESSYYKPYSKKSLELIETNIDVIKCSDSVTITFNFYGTKI